MKIINENWLSHDHQIELIINVAEVHFIININYLREEQSKPASREIDACLFDTSICRSFDPKDQLYQATQGAFFLEEILNFAFF